MRNSKIVMGLLACLFFGLALAGLFKDWPSWILMLLILLHSACLMLLAFIYSAERNDYSDRQELTEELATLKKERETERDTMQKALDARETELRTKGEELKRLTEEAGEKEEKISALKAAVKTAEDKLVQQKEDINDFLPPVEDAPKMVDVIRIARETADELAGAARDAGLTVRISSSEEQLYVKAQPNWLRILFRNIIDNSIKYMQRSGSLVITLSLVGDDIFIVLKDTGAGLKEEETKHIFELNYQGSNRISGNGLGLTQAKAIVDYYGGTIYGRSTPNNGMGIYIQLPAKRQIKEDEE
ncbi:MAG: HAMP domain-containing histidine kinase [Lachnospiraceae bacterium]|nr:HAMP domain-containing histidine kinase [Lachnospiraceae bacterium]